MNRRNLLATGAGLAITPGAHAAETGIVNPDAELLRLGTLFDARRAAELAAWGDVPDGDGNNSPRAMRAYRVAEAVREVTGVIVATPAKTLAGVLVKRRVVAYCYAGNPVPAERLAPYPDTGLEAIAAILADLDVMERAGA